jgi:hypothetical protein
LPRRRSRRLVTTRRNGLALPRGQRKA